VARAAEGLEVAVVERGASDRDFLDVVDIEGTLARAYPARLARVMVAAQHHAPGGVPEESSMKPPPASATAVRRAPASKGLAALDAACGPPGGRPLCRPAAEPRNGVPGQLAAPPQRRTRPHPRRAHPGGSRIFASTGGQRALSDAALAVRMRVRRLDGRLPEHQQLRWSPDTAPILEVEPGEVVELLLPDSSTGQLSASSTTADLGRLDWGQVDAAVGPIAVTGAEPGDTLRVEIRSIEPGNWGWTAVFENFGLLRNRFHDALSTWKIRAGVAVASRGFLAGLRVPLRPMLGVLGVLPADGSHPMVPPDRFGGNLDLPLVAGGARVDFPVEVPGAGLSAGDPHGRQGWGEVCGTGIEMPCRVRLRPLLRKRHAIPAPQVRSPARADPDLGSITTLGIGPDPRRAAERALESMIERLSANGWSPEAACAVTSLVGALRIAEAVDEPNWVLALSVPEEFERPPPRTARRGTSEREKPSHSRGAK
jgi:acetamidase/formamidase